MDNTSKLVDFDQFREKLIEMVNNARDARTGQDLAERIADHLIANGVTIPQRCKDCKHWKHFAHLGCSDIAKVCMLANYMIGANGYCLYGERKDNEII